MLPACWDLTSSSHSQFQGSEPPVYLILFPTHVQQCVESRAAIHFGTSPHPPPPLVVWLSSCSCHTRDLEVLLQPSPALYYPSLQQTQHSGAQVPPACRSLPLHGRVVPPTPSLENLPLSLATACFFLRLFHCHQAVCSVFMTCPFKPYL